MLAITKELLLFLNAHHHSTEWMPRYQMGPFPRREENWEGIKAIYNNTIWMIKLLLGSSLNLEQN